MFLVNISVKSPKFLKFDKIQEKTFFIMITACSRLCKVFLLLSEISVLVSLNRCANRMSSVNQSSGNRLFFHTHTKNRSGINRRIHKQEDFRKKNSQQAHYHQQVNPEPDNNAPWEMGIMEHKSKPAPVFMIKQRIFPDRWTEKDDLFAPRSVLRE